MKRSVFTLFIMLLTILPTSLFAQRGKPDKRARQKMQDETQIRMLSTENPNDTAIIEIFKTVAPEEKHAPKLPRFSIIGQDHKFYIAVGGYMKGIMGYDFGSPVQNPNFFVTDNIPIPKPAGDGALYQMSAAASTIYLNFVALPGTDNQLGAYINFNFLKGNYLFNLQYAYFKYCNFLLGFNYTLFCDTKACPFTIDFEGPPSWATVFNTVFNYTYYTGPFQMAVGLELPMYSNTFAKSLTDTIYQRIPAVPMYFQYSFPNKVGYIRASAIFRDVQYRDLINNKNRTRFGWGTQLSGLANITPEFTFYWQGVYGKGIASFLQDTNGNGLDLVPSDTPGKMKPVEIWGGYLGMTYNFTKSLSANVLYSQVRCYPERNEYTETSYKYAQYALGNLIWSLNSTVQTGIEYIYGRKHILNGKQAHDNRIQAMLQFNF